MFVIRGKINGTMSYYRKARGVGADHTRACVAANTTGSYETQLFTEKRDAENALDGLTHGIAKLCGIVEMVEDYNVPIKNTDGRKLVR